jgi:DNA-binding IscR family transcriptional regulator
VDEADATIAKPRVPQIWQPLTHELWYGLNETIHEYLGKINLQQLVDGQMRSETAEVKVTPMNKASQQVTA